MRKFSALETSRTHPELLALKMELVPETKVDAMVTANPGCILQLRAGTVILTTPHEVLQVVELLDRAVI